MTIFNLTPVTKRALESALTEPSAYTQVKDILEKSGLTAVSVTGDTTLALATHSVQVGKYVEVDGDDKTLTLPAVTVGSSYIIVNKRADASSGVTISPNSSDKFLVDIAGAAGTDNKDIVNTKATSKKNDYVHLIGLSSAGWLIHDVRGTWVDES